MRAFRPLMLTVLVGTLATIPATAHAAGYKSYASAPCSYTIDYPVGWSISKSGNSTTFSAKSSTTPYAAVIVDCTKPSQHVSTTSLTVSEMNSFKKQGYTLSK